MTWVSDYRAVHGHLASPSPDHDTAPSLGDVVHHHETAAPDADFDTVMAFVDYPEAAEPVAVAAVGDGQVEAYSCLQHLAILPVFPDQM